MGATALRAASLTFFRQIEVVKKRNTKLAVAAVFAGLAMVGVKSSLWTQPVLAKPAFMDRYNRNPYAKDEFKTDCTICHIGNGGGERNDFGEAFEDSGYRFTPKLREKFPKFFKLKAAKTRESDASPTPSP